MPFVSQAAKTVVGYQKREVAKKPWITKQMLDKMEERRRWKSINTDRSRQLYKTLNNELRRETQKAKEAWWESECKQMEELGRKGLTSVLFKS